MSATDKPKIGCIGLGDQGLPMALAIAEAGFPLHVWVRKGGSLDVILNGLSLASRDDANRKTLKAAIVICLSFTWAAFEKLATPIPKLATMWPWVGSLPVTAVRVLGLVDLAGGLGVLLPSLTRIWPGLAIVAAFGCAALQICAMIFHLSRGEIAVLPVNLGFLALALFIAFGRLWISIPSGR